MRNQVTDNQLTAGFKGTAILLVVAVCWALVLACSQSLHELVHPDAPHEDHQCAVTLMIDNGFETPSVTPVILFTALILINLLPQLRQQVIQMLTDRSNLHVRAPPVT